MIHLYGGSGGTYEERCRGVWNNQTLCGKIVDRSETTGAIEKVNCRQCLRLRLSKRRTEAVRLADRIARLEAQIAGLKKDT